MRDYGVSTAVDLRAPRERARSPSPVQDWSGYRARPMFDDPALAFIEDRFRHDSTGFYVASPAAVVYGGAGGYLRAAGVDAPTQARLRDRLTGP